MQINHGDQKLFVEGNAIFKACMTMEVLHKNTGGTAGD
jgi:hypothetical protein